MKKKKIHFKVTIFIKIFLAKSDEFSVSLNTPYLYDTPNFINKTENFKIKDNNSLNNKKIKNLLNNPKNNTSGNKKN